MMLDFSALPLTLGDRGQRSVALLKVCCYAARFGAQFSGEPISQGVAKRFNVPDAIVAQLAHSLDAYR